MKAIPVKPIVDGLATTIVMVELPPDRMLVGENDLVMVGAKTTVTSSAVDEVTT